jgi:hypothetical protein
LKAQRLELLSRLEAARAATSEAIAREQRLMKQLALLDGRASEMVAVEEKEMAVEDPKDAFLDDAIPLPGELALSPFTWSATDGLPDSLWFSSDLPLPAVVETGEEAAGNS